MHRRQSTFFSISSQAKVLPTLFLTKRALNVDAISNTFNPLWHCRTGFKIQNQGDHKVLFIFDNKPDMERVLSSEPWSFNKFLIVLNRYDNDVLIRDLQFNEATFWVQVHDIPIRYRNKAMAKKNM